MDDLDKEIDELYKKNKKKIPQKTKKCLLIFVFALIYGSLAHIFITFFPSNTLLIILYCFTMFIVVVILIISIFTFSSFSSEKSKIEKRIKSDEISIRKYIIEPILKEKLHSFDYNLDNGLTSSDTEEISHNLSISFSRSLSTSIAVISDDRKVVEIADLDLCSSSGSGDTGYIRRFAGYIVRIKFSDFSSEEIVFKKALPPGLKYFVSNDKLCFAIEKRPSPSVVINPKRFARKTIELFLSINDFANLLLENRLTKEAINIEFLACS